MVVGGKENLHPNSSQQNDLIHIDTDVVKPLGSLFDVQRPLLFSEIVFSDANGKQFGISCTSETTTNTNTATDSTTTLR